MQQYSLLIRLNVVPQYLANHLVGEPARRQKPPLTGIFSPIRGQPACAEPLAPDLGGAIKLGFAQRAPNLGDRFFVDALLAELLRNPSNAMDRRLAVNQPLHITIVGLPALCGKSIEYPLDLAWILCVGRQLAGKFKPAMLASRQ